MLSIGKIAAGPKAARYYTDQVARGRDDYYAGEGEEPGRWVGLGATALGWSGEVDADDFAHLLAGAGLRRAVREGAVAGFDLTFRAPKSVGLLWGIASPEVVAELRAGHDAAVGEALGYLEREACRARRGAGGHIQVAGGGFVGAAFVHRASREGDPLLHTHVVVGNLTRGPDERWTALDARHVYRQAKTAGYLYQAVLRRELTERLGVEWERVENGAADVRGIARSVIEHFSERRAQIVEHMERHGGRSAASAQVAALETRRAKRDVPVDRLREVWRSRAAEHGLDARGVAAVFGRDRQLPWPATPIDPDALTAEASTFGRAELLQALAQAQPRGARVEDLERLADAVLADREIVILQDGLAPAGVSERRFTTHDMLAVERELLERAARRRHAGAAVASPRAELVLADSALSDEQARVVRDLVRAGEGIAIVRAAAGTGKTFALDAAREAWERSGIDVVGCAVSARAALELQDQAGIPSLTIAALRVRLERGGELPRGGVLVVDEAGMVGTRALNDLSCAVERVDGKLVLVGDDRQLPEIEAGGAFRGLADRLGAGELREVRRQREAWDRDALDRLRDGDVERWARAYRERGRITVARTAAQARAALVNDWSRADGDRLMIAGRRDDVRDLNERARELLRDRGELGRDELDAAGRSFAVGDRVVGRRNDHDLGILNGQRGTVRDIDQNGRILDVELDGGKKVTLDERYLDAGHLDHGYAITAHRAQGATVDRTFVLGSEELYREWGYTALSRHREEARFYVTDSDLDIDRDRDHAPEPDDVAAGIERLMSRSRAKELALDSLTEADEREPRRDREARREGHERDPTPPREAGQHSKEVALDRLPELDERELRRERGALREEFEHDSAPLPQAHRHADEVERTAAARDEARERDAALRERREQTHWWQRAERADLDEIHHQHARAIDTLTERYLDALADHDLADRMEQRWLSEHAADAERYLAIDNELRTRAIADRDAARRLERLDRRPDPLARAPEPPAMHPDLGPDIDFGP